MKYVAISFVLFAGAAAFADCKPNGKCAHEGQRHYCTNDKGQREEYECRVTGGSLQMKHLQTFDEEPGPHND